jgi:hypothetical protein
MPRTFIRPLTYAPKIQGVLDGTIRQTIRAGQKLAAGDRILFHGWAGKPYRSKWSFRTPYYTLIAVIPIRIRPDGLLFESNGEVRPWADLDDLAARDGIDPPTGDGLREVLLGMHAVPASGVAGQILRW